MTLISAIVGTLAAYPIARMEFAAAPFAARAIVTAYLLPLSLCSSCCSSLQTAGADRLEAGAFIDLHCAPSAPGC